MVDNSRTAAKARSAQVLRNSPRAMPLSGHSSKGATKEQQGIIRCRAGVGGQGSCAAMESPKTLMCHLKMGLAGLTSRHQTTGRVFATANTWRTQRPHGVSGFGTESQ